MIDQVDQFAIDGLFGSRMLEELPAPASLSSRRNLVLVAAGLGWMFDGFEMGVFPMIARPALQQMQAGGAVTDAFVGHWMGIITALFLCGAALGGGLFGWLGDRIGRVRAMTLSVLCYSVFTGAIYFSRTPLELGLLRFVAALGMGGEWSLGVALVMEIWSEEHRAALAGLIGAANNVGFALVAIAGLSFSVTTSTWRYVALIGMVPGLLAFLIQRFVPESERWQKAAAAGDLQPLREIARTPALRLTLIASLLAGVALIGSWGSVQWVPLWADQLVGGLLPQAKAYAQLYTALGAIVGGFAGAFLAGRLGRRVAYAWMCVASLGACSLLFRGSWGYGTPFLAMTFLLGAATTTFYGWLPLYLPELFPTRIRATAQGIAFNVGRLLAAAGALEMGNLMQAMGGSYPRAGGTISLIYLVGLGAIWFAPETRGRPLPA